MIMKQDVLNYETDIIRRQSEAELLFDKHDHHNYRYGVWNLQDTLNRLLPHSSPTLKWIGNDPNANAIAFFYAVLAGCLHEDYRSEEIFYKLKHSLYHECRDSLSITQQKIFVEHLCLLEYSKDVGEFLKKSSHLESILLKIFLMKKKQMNKKDIKRTSGNIRNKIHELQWIAVIFPFISYQIVDERCGKIIINDKTFFIVEEKECFFLVENNGAEETQTKMSTVSSTKNLKTPASLTKIRSAESLKTLDMMMTKHPEGQQKKKKYLHEQTSFKGLEPAHQPPRRCSQQQSKVKAALSITQKNQRQDSNRNNNKSFNIFECIKEVKESRENQQSQNMKGVKKLQLFDNNDFFESLRSSLNKAKTPTKDFGGVIAQKSFTEQSHPKRSIDNEQAESLQKIQMLWRPQKEKQQETNKPIKKRGDFIHQSLGSKEAALGAQMLSPKVSNNQKKGTPKFLTKKFDEKSQTATQTPNPHKAAYKPMRQTIKSPILMKKQAQHISVPILKPMPELESQGSDLKPPSSGNFDKKGTQVQPKGFHPGNFLKKQ